MIFMPDENKPAEAKTQSVVFVKKSTLILIIAGIVIIAALVVGWRLFSGNSSAQYIASDSPILGNGTVYVIEFSDYLCPYCQAAEGVNQEVIGTLKQSDPSWQAPIPVIIQDYVNTGKVSLVFRNYPVHNNNEPALAAKCAQEQDKYWEYHSMLFENYNALSNTDLQKYALNLSLNMSRFNQCFDSKKYQSSIDNDVRDGNGLGVSATPTFFIGNNQTGYERIVGALSFSSFKEIIDSKISV
jgi:protein-disulfide isomerase